MGNIRVDLEYAIKDGTELVFKAPCDCSEVSGLIVYYPDIETGDEISSTFSFADAHGSNLANVNDLFTKGVYVKVILNTTDYIAYIQNGDTNSYLEARFDDSPDGTVYVDGTGEEVEEVKSIDADLLGGKRPEYYASAKDLGTATLGFEESTVTFNPDGSITEERVGGTLVTVFNSDGSITETFTKENGEAMSKKTVFNADGSISVTIG